MKKTKIVSLVLFIGVIILFSGCASMVEKILPSEELIIAPDPNNPLQGTWMSVFPSGYMHVINGMNGEWYVRVRKRSVNTWDKLAVYTIEKQGNGYIASVSSSSTNTSNNWSISVNNDTLTVEGMQYIRYDRYVGK
jgi:ABC-type transport system involved in multi-copper enzyme maturation permease subunit